MTEMNDHILVSELLSVTLPQRDRKAHLVAQYMLRVAGRIIQIEKPVEQVYCQPSNAGAGAYYPSCH